MSCLQTNTKSITVKNKWAIEIWIGKTWKVQQHGMPRLSSPPQTRHQKRSVNNLPYVLLRVIQANNKLHHKHISFFISIMMQRLGKGIVNNTSHTDLHWLLAQLKVLKSVITVLWREFNLLQATWASGINACNGGFLSDVILFLVHM